MENDNQIILYTSVAHCCRGRPRRRAVAQLRGVPSGLHRTSLTREAALLLAILLYRAICLEAKMFESGCATALRRTSSLLTLETYEQGMPMMRLKLLQWKASSRILSARRSQTESREYSSLLNTHVS